MGSEQTSTCRNSSISHLPAPIRNHQQPFPPFTSNATLPRRQTRDAKLVKVLSRTVKKMSTAPLSLRTVSPPTSMPEPLLPPHQHAKLLPFQSGSSTPRPQAVRWYVRIEDREPADHNTFVKAWNWRSMAQDLYRELARRPQAQPFAASHAYNMFDEMLDRPRQAPRISGGPGLLRRRRLR